MLLQPGKWRLRQPRWMQMQRAHMLMLFRAIHAVKSRGATTDSPKLPLSCVPATYKVSSFEFDYFHIRDNLRLTQGVSQSLFLLLTLLGHILMACFTSERLSK